MFAERIDRIIDDFKFNPRNKVHIDEATLIACATEETGNEVTAEQFRSAVGNFLSGDMDGDDYQVYDGAVYACSVAAKHCFGDPENHEDDDDYSIDYELDWLESSDGSYAAEVRPT